jgi:mRNA interferase MazF
MMIFSIKVADVVMCEAVKILFVCGVLNTKLYYMIKNFDAWNENKKEIHITDANKNYHRRDVWWCALGVNIGFEEDGKGKKSERPVLVIHGFNRQLCWVVPLSRSEKKNRYYIPVGIVDGKKAFAIISQMRPIDTKRLTNKICFMDEKYFEATKQAIKDIL